ncbi:MAG: transaldolase [Bryobacteraceae bacterium]
MSTLRKNSSTQLLHDSGQSIWLDNITRDLLLTGTLARYVDQLSVTGLTSNPSIFDHAIKSTTAYDETIRAKRASGSLGEDLFFELAVDDIANAADLFRPIHERTDGVDGWVSLEVSPLLAHDATRTVEAVKNLHARVGRPNVFIKIPGTREGLRAIEESIFAGIPVNVTLLFSPEQYLAAAQAFLSGVDRRIAAGLNPNVASVASVFISRWDVAVRNEVPAKLANKLGIAIAGKTHDIYQSLLQSPRWHRAYNFGVRPQRLLWASTGTKDPQASPLLYVKALAAPFTVNTMPEATLHALAEQNEFAVSLDLDGAYGKDIIREFSQAGIDIDSLGARLQDEGANLFVRSWTDLLEVIDSKATVLAKAV